MTESVTPWGITVLLLAKGNYIMLLSNGLFHSTRQVDKSTATVTLEEFLEVPDIPSNWKSFLAICTPTCQIKQTKDYSISHQFYL